MAKIDPHRLLERVEAKSRSYEAQLRDRVGKTGAPEQIAARVEAELRAYPGFFVKKEFQIVYADAMASVMREEAAKLFPSKVVTITTEHGFGISPMAAQDIMWQYLKKEAERFHRPPPAKRSVVPSKNYRVAMADLLGKGDAGVADSWFSTIKFAVSPPFTTEEEVEAAVRTLERKMLPWIKNARCDYWSVGSEQEITFDIFRFTREKVKRSR